MRIRLVILLGLIFTTLTVSAGEVLPVARMGTDLYSNVTIVAVTPADVLFKSDRGMANAKLKSLNPWLQKHFNYSPVKADALEKELRALKFPYPFPATHQIINQSNAQAIMNTAMTRAKAIINQPVAAFPMTPDIRVVTFKPWFHPGAEKPDFKTVDIRTTQQKVYDQYSYVNSDENPYVYYVGSDLEFNSMTKYFYVDRSVPKKKLTEAEMLEINRLYRIIADCEEELNQP
jgi:hypothetical protein